MKLALLIAIGALTAVSGYGQTSTTPPVIYLPAYLALRKLRRQGSSDVCPILAGNVG
jgi:hypothetical protein